MYVVALGAGAARRYGSGSVSQTKKHLKLEVGKSGVKREPLGTRSPPGLLYCITFSRVQCFIHRHSTVHSANTLTSL